MKKRNEQGDCKRRRRLEGDAKKLEWYAYWRTVRHSRRLLGDAAPKPVPFK